MTTEIILYEPLSYLKFTKGLKMMENDVYVCIYIRIHMYCFLTSLIPPQKLNE